LFELQNKLTTIIFCLTIELICYIRGGKMMVFEKLQKIIVEELGVEKSEVTLEANINDDLGADSLDAVELIMAIEDEFEISVSDDVAQDLKTVQQIVDYIESQK